LVAVVELVAMIDQQVPQVAEDLVEEHREVLNHLLGVQLGSAATAAALLKQEHLDRVIMVVLVYGHGIQVVAVELALLEELIQQQEELVFQVLLQEFLIFGAVVEVDLVIVGVAAMEEMVAAVAEQLILHSEVLD
jgi:hypothetical protein